VQTAQTEAAAPEPEPESEPEPNGASHGLISGRPLYFITLWNGAACTHNYGPPDHHTIPPPPGGGGHNGAPLDARGLMAVRAAAGAEAEAEEAAPSRVRGGRTAVLPRPPSRPYVASL
jgi:hypothetical protein